jgi:glycosyltransferase involved in cell wall biosynthesis
MMKKGEERCPSTLVIVATLNEEEGVGPTLAEIKSFLGCPPFLVVDGHSTDATVRIAEGVGAKVIAQKGFGKGDAIAAAMAHGWTPAPKYIVFIDADFTYPAEYLPRMIKILDENSDVGMVCGNRFNGHLRLEAMHDMFYLGNRLLAFTHNIFNGVDLQDPLTGLRVVRWKILRDWKPRSKGFDVEVELNHYVERKGYAILEIPIQYSQRLGEKKLKLRHGLTILKRIFRESFTEPSFRDRTEMLKF